MQSLTSIRRDVRALVQSRAYAQLDAYYADLEQQDWADTENPGAPYFEAANSGTLFDYSTVSYQDASDFLQAWIAAHPDSYHAQLVMGNFCYGRAADIRGYGWADSVTQDRWVGAALACERSAAALLQAMALSPRPIAACVTMMQLAAHFKEPYWLRALFTGNPPETLTHDDIEEEGLMDAALAHLASVGVPRLQEAPQTLPAWLAPRAEHEIEQAKDYWLLRALDLRPGHLGALTAYAQYLQPRWGGSYEDIDGMAGGPLCAALTEPQRNAIRWIGIYDSLDSYPEPDDTQAVEEYCRVFDSFLQRELRPTERGMALGYYAQFASYSLQDQARARALHGQSVAAFGPNEYFAQVDGPFRSFAHVSIIHHQPDDDGAFKRVLERMCGWDQVATAHALAAVAHQFGRWGFAQDPARAQQLLDRAAVMAAGQMDDDFNVLAAAAMLWDGGDHEQGYFLSRQLADRRVPDAACSMYDIHRGFRDNTPDSYLDNEVRDQWLARAVEDGSPLAKYNMAHRNIFDGEMDFSRRENLDRVLWLLQGAREEPRAEALARLRIGVLLRDHGTEQEQQEGVRAYLRPLVEEDDDWRAGRASAEIALAYTHGRGAKKNRFAAIEWAQHACRLQPDDEDIEDIQAQVMNSHSLVKTIGTVFGAYLGRGGVSAEDLPPKPAAQ
ncbi:DUF4034 domain-containing protein [Achromobacter aegrifaciens]|uniref:DUF4034 domain-containing protein n=1 Tax=Achromobacter aegrifaciens TaxID=1287736 RepID=UPI0028B14085|nr:DUF4034 domain-containing protein [Achromobacter aegrifaciens]